jgi:hypothetical protein
MADRQVRQELGEIYSLIDIGELATIEGLMNELNVSERLDALIDKCLKRLLMVRGVKSLSLTSPSAPAKKKMTHRICIPGINTD